jgi:hypothetical protein
MEIDVWRDDDGDLRLELWHSPRCVLAVGLRRWGIYWAGHFGRRRICGQLGGGA